MTETLVFTAKEANLEDLHEEREIMRQIRMFGIPKKRPVIVQKKYIFHCPKCGEICMIIPEGELSHYRRTWKLLANKPLTNTEIVEFVSLCEQGYRYIGLFCPNEECNGECDVVLMTEKEWNAHVQYAEVVYELSENAQFNA